MALNATTLRATTSARKCAQGARPSATARAAARSSTGNLATRRLVCPRQQHPLLRLPLQQRRPHKARPCIVCWATRAHGVHEARPHSTAANGVCSRRCWCACASQPKPLFTCGRQPLLPSPLAVPRSQAVLRPQARKQRTSATAGASCGCCRTPHPPGFSGVHAASGWSGGQNEAHRRSSG